MDADDEVRELYEALAERDRHIDELEAELTAQEEENDKRRDDLIQSHDKISELQVLVKELRLENDGLLGEKSQLEDQLNARISQLDAQKSILAVAAKSSEEAKKVQKDGNQQLHRLELENQRLRATVLEIEENEDILVNEIDTLVREKSEFQEQSEELASKCDLLYADFDEKDRNNSQLLQEKEKAQKALATHSEEYRRDKDEYRRKDAASRSEITRLLAELEQERAKHKELAHIKENEAFRQELIKVRKENGKLNSLYDQCLLDKNQAERDLDSAIQALNQSKRNAKERVASALRKEKTAVTETNAKLDRANTKLDSALQRCTDGEDQIDDLRRQLQRSEAREKNHGLAEAIQCQKQLEADVRRRDYDLKRLTKTIGIEMDKVLVLTKACDWLKEKANLGPDFKFDDEEIKMALEREDTGLKSENIELSRQINSLEGERTKLLSQLRERSIEIGEKGVRFLGMNAHQVVQVTEFASNLRRGVIELPLNDRSKELLVEISSLKSDKEVDRVTIARLEREIETSKAPREGESNMMEQLLNRMTTDNQKLRDENAALSQTAESVLTPMVRGRAKKILGEDLVKMPSAAEVQFILLMNEYDNATQELDLLKTRMATQGTGWVRSDSVQPTEAKAIIEVPDKQVNEDNALPDLCLDADTIPLNERFRSMQKDTVDLRGELQKEKQAISDVQGKCGEQILYLEKWKIDAITVMERQVATSNSNDNIHYHERKNVDELISILRKSQKQNHEYVKLVSDGLCDSSGTHAEMKSMYDSLERTQMKLSVYIGDVRNFHEKISNLTINPAIQENRIDSANVAIKISCLNDIINEKNRIIKESKRKLTAANQMNFQLSRDIGFREHKSDRSISTNSIDKSIFRAANSSGYSTPTRNQIQNHLEDATKLIFEKESVISEQKQSILELKQKLTSTEESRRQLMKDAESMKTDISTLVSRLSETESAVNGISAYQEQHEEAQDLLNKNKKEVNAMRIKLSNLHAMAKEKDIKIKELEDSVGRAKRILSVTRQGRARSEQHLKISNEEVTSLKDELEKMRGQMNDLKKGKIDAQNEKLKISRKTRISAIKLKETSKAIEELEKSKTVEELEKRVNVLNKTVSSLASQNSKLRGELAAHKLKKKANEDTATQQMMPRSSISRERPMSSRAKILEDQVKTLQRSLAQEKKHASDSSSMLDRYQRRIYSLENAIQSATGTNASEEFQSTTTEDNFEPLQQQLLSLKNENSSLKQRIEDIKSEGNVKDQIGQLKSENDRLKKETERLSQIDHLDFFEEIEDLKYKYNDAVRQINQLTTG